MTVLNLLSSTQGQKGNEANIALAKEIYAALVLIMKTVEKGSVITIDCGIEILAKLNKYREYFNTTDPLLIEQLWKCPIKQLPMYVEKSLISINKKNNTRYISMD